METTAPTGPQTEVVTFRGHDGVTLTASRWVPSAPSAGTGTPPSVLFFHGGGQTRHSWKRAGELLARAGYPALTFDLRGHGDSTWSPDGEYTIRHFADDIVGVVGQLGTRVVLVGASLGGLSSLLASASIEPAVLAGLVLVDVVPQIERQGQDRIRTFMASTVDGFDSLEEAAEVIAGYLTHRTPRAVTEGLQRNLKQGPDGRWRWHWDPAFITNVGENPVVEVDRLEAAARSLHAPALLIRGLLSDVVSDEGVAALRALNPSLEYVELADVAHTAAGDDNDAFVGTVLEFIARGDSASPDRSVDPAL